jgi:class 3 adenylate cyclase/DNA-binding SARP family transcriptional activator
MEFRILGPLEVLEDGRQLDLGGAKQRVLLAILLLHANEVVSTDRLIEALWADEPPETAQKALQVHVSQLRKLVGRERLETRLPGYRLRIGERELDLERFRRLAEERWREALSLWRGPPLAEFEYQRFAQVEIARLEELRIACLERRIEEDLEHGRHAALVGELEQLVHEHPLRERLRGQLMLALYRSGRQAEALEAYQEGRRLLAGELGLEPGEALKELQHAILAHDPTLGLRAEAPTVEPDSLGQSRCPSCGTATEPESRFCAACGHRLDRPSTRYEERKLVTVLFADLLGSTALGEQLDPERLRTLLSEYFSAMASVIESQGGVVEKFIGDAVMAVFGVPTAHEDDAERALRAALGMHTRLQELNAEIAARHGVELAIRIGVNSGEVIAGTEADQFMVTGDVVNVAARLQQTARPGEVAAGERTYLATRGAFAAEPIDDRALKGKSLQVRAWRVLGTAEPARPRGVPGITSRLVGRERELTLLETFYRGSTDDARPALVTILGQPGIGKSRLTAEFIAGVRAGPEAPAFYQGRCLPYGEGITYWALREILWEAAGIMLGDSPEVAADKLGTLVHALLDQAGVDPGEVDRVLFALATTAGIALQENPLQEMSPESIGEELGLAWPRFLSALAARAPTLVVIEDLHRGEPPLLNMVEHLVTRSTGPVFIIATGRPELAQMRAGWSGRSGMSQITLDPLPDAQAETLLQELLPSVGLDLRHRVLAAAEGNPLFAEEIVAHLIDQGVLAWSSDGIVEVAPDANVTIPDTVRALLAARVDALPLEEKRTLQDAAVVGRIFWTTTLEAMRDGAVRPSLRALEEKGFVVTRPTSSLSGQTELAFRHGLIRDVAYESIPKGRRATAHAEVGRWIEELVGDRREEYVELIAHHYESAARPEDSELAWPTDPARRDAVRTRAVGALVDAGRAATAKFAIDQALDFGDRALALARSEDERLAALELKALAAHAAVRADEAWSYYVEALDVAEDIGNSDAAQRLGAHATLLWARYRGALTGEDWTPKAVAIVRNGLEEGDGARASFELGAFLIGRTAFRSWNMAPHAKEDARSDAERAVTIAQEIGSQTLLSYALDGLVMEIEQDGFCESAALAGRALAVGRSMEDRGEKHELLVTAAIAFADAGRFDDAAIAGAEAASLAARLGPHRGLHAGSAQTHALLPPGRLTELQEATATAVDLVAEEEMHTCFHGLTALAGQAISAYEVGDAGAARRTLEVYDTAVISGAGTRVFQTIEMLRPLIGAREVRRRVDQVELADAVRASVQAEVYRLRVELQLNALERQWARLHELADRARALAASACAPYLDWIADWSQGVELADRGQIRESIAKARTAASAPEAYGERYLAARLLVDLLPRLDSGAASELAEHTIQRLEAMGAAGSAAEAYSWLSSR